MSLSRSCSLFPVRFYVLHSKPICLSFFSSLSHSNLHASTPNANSDPRNPALFNYLIDSFGLSKQRALSLCNQNNLIKAYGNPQSVVDFFNSLGFSDAHIRSLVRTSPQLLFADINKSLKPKLQLFRELDISDSDLPSFISKNPWILTISLENKLRPCVRSLKKILKGCNVNNDLIRVLGRANRFATAFDKSRFSSNVSYLKSCGISESQLSKLLVTKSRIFTINESELRDIVSRALDMGFTVKSGMLVYGIQVIGSLNNETINRKIELFKSFGFSETERMEMFRKAPLLLTTSEEKLKLGIEFLMKTAKFGKGMFVCNPAMLMLSMKDRVMPRYRVMQILISKKLLKKEPSFQYVLQMPEKKFSDKFISRFKDDADELLVAYNKGNVVDLDSKSL